ncbi:MAG: hypothetical protein AAF823_07170 [Planctomycetota bacterium]
MFAWVSLLENAGEPAIDSRYRDPAVLADLGYTGGVLYETTALSGLNGLDSVRSSEIRSWLGARVEAIDEKLAGYQNAGMEAYASFDALVLPKETIEAGGASMRCKGRTALCPASEATWAAVLGSLESHLERWPQLAGVVIRFGDHDADRLPHLSGNDLYSPHCPRCSSMDAATRIADLVRRYRELVVDRFGKRLIVRAWNVRPGGLHDDPALAKKVVGKLDPAWNDGRVVFSFKFTQTDFWRYQPWNPSSLAMGDWPVVYELQCQREFEGKGGVPNWQAPLWRDGMPEMQASDPLGGGLSEATKRANVVGVWAWARGGGWGGPFVGDERWIDANVAAVPALANDPQAPLDRLADDWLKDRVGVKQASTRRVLGEVLAESAELVRKAFYLEAHAVHRPDAWHPHGDWVQDDVVDAEALWRLIKRLPEPALDAVVAEKRDASARMADLRGRVQREVGDRQHTDLEPLTNTLLYAEALFDAWRDLVDGLVTYRRRGQGQADGRAVMNRLAAAQSHWNHHVQRFSSLPGTATAFRERSLWDLTQRLMDEASGA